jgi:hypothetical protein
MALANEHIPSSKSFVASRVVSLFVTAYWSVFLGFRLERHPAILGNSSRPLPCHLGRFLLEIYFGPLFHFLFRVLVFFAHFVLTRMSVAGRCLAELLDEAACDNRQATAS